MANYTSFSKLRRLGRRAVRVLGRHQGASSFFGGFVSTLGPAVAQFDELHDRVAVIAAKKNLERQEGLQAVLALQTRVRGWLPSLSRDVPTVDVSVFRARTEVPDDTIAAAERLLEVVRAHMEGSAQPLPYGEQLIEDLTQGIAAADSEWAQAQAVLAEQQALQAELRKAADALHQQLVSFRSALRTALGSSHRDYQKLRLERAAEADADDEDVAVEGAAAPADVADETPEELGEAPTLPGSGNGRSVADVTPSFVEPPPVAMAKGVTS